PSPQDRRPRQDTPPEGPAGRAKTSSSFYCLRMAAKPKQLLENLSHAGPYEVRRGDLALVGLPGVVFTPQQGLNLPAVVFGHGWMQPPGRYRDLLRHLASWGIVAAAPATHRGPLPSHRLYAADLHNTAEIITRVRLGQDGVSLDPDRLGVAGHSVGGGAAVLAAAGDADPRFRAVATVTPAQTMPAADDAARRITTPGMHLAADAHLGAASGTNRRHRAKALERPVRVG